MKRWRRRILLAACLLVMLVLTGSLAYGGENLKAEFDSATNGIFVYDGNGTPIAKMSVPGARISPMIASNKSYIYLSVCVEKDGTFQNYLYQYKRANGKLSKLKKLPEGFFSFVVEDIIGDVLYLSGDEVGTDNKVVSYTYNTKNKKLKIVNVDNAGFDQRYGSYFVMSGRRRAGIFYGYPIYLYQVETGKATRLCEYSDFHTISGKYLYYSVKQQKEQLPDTPHQIVQVNLKTGKKKVLAEAISCMRVKNITKTMVEYYKRAQELARYYFKNGRSYHIAESTPVDFVPKDKTAALQAKLQKILGHFVASFATLAPSKYFFNYREESVYLNTGFIFYSKLMKVYGKTVAELEAPLKKYLKKYFNSDKIGIVTNDPSQTYPYTPQYFYRVSEDGTMRYYWGDWGNEVPSGKVGTVTKVFTDLFQAEYSVSLKNTITGTSRQLGDFLITFQKSGSSYYITDIVRTYSAVESLY